jgi:Uri superfamily endonuclease
MKGSFILAIFLDKDINLKIGKLGTAFFKKGFYYYVGSAMGSYGSNTLANRVKRHLRNSNIKKIYWHIDYFLAYFLLFFSLIYFIPIKKKIECLIIQDSIKYSNLYIENFCCSDCQCASHLIYF